MFASAAVTRHTTAPRARVKQLATAVALTAFIAMLALVSPTPALAQGNVVQMDK